VYNVLLSRKEALLDPILSSFLSSIINKDDHVVVISFSFFSKDIKYKEEYHNIYGFPHGSYSQTLLAKLGEIGIKEDKVESIDYYLDNKESALKKLKKANIVYLPGGNPLEFIRRCEEFGITNASFNNVKLVIGSSCGAVVQLKNYHLTPDLDIDHFCFSHGLNIINNDFLVDVHYQDNLEFNYSIELIQNFKYKKYYGITNEGYLVFKDNLLILKDNVVELDLNVKGDL
jgi:peptidase E